MRAKKSLGQHFLKNEHVVRKIVAAGNVTEHDIVFEIGPGTGVLTKALLETGAAVVALEADVRAIEALEKTFEKEIAGGRLHLIHDDARTFDFDSRFDSFGFTQGGYKVIANIPYYLSGFLFEKMLTAPVKPACMVFLVQKEVAERIARSEKESILSLSVKAYGVPRYISTVAKGNFTPPPKVDSAILLVSDIPETTVYHFADVRETDFFTLIKTGLRAKRKQLIGNLTTLSTRAELETLFDSLSLSHDVRGEDVPLEIWMKLTSQLFAHTK